MKNLNSKNIITVLLISLLSANIAIGQGRYAVESIQKLPVEGFKVKFNPGGDKLLLTSSNSHGLKLYDLETGELQEVSKEGKAGHKAIINESEVIFSLKDGRTLSIFNLDKKQLTSISSNLSPEEYEVKNKVAKGEFVLAKTSEYLDKIILVKGNGNEVVLTPKGNGDYLNVSLSPDRTKILFRVSGIGSFISDTNGQIIKELGNVEFPAWIDNESVLYAQIEDDGYRYIKSDLFIQGIRESKVRHLTNSTDAISLYPAANISQKKIAFNTPNGEIYIINLVEE